MNYRSKSNLGLTKTTVRRHLHANRGLRKKAFYLSVKHKHKCLEFVKHHCIRPEQCSVVWWSSNVARNKAINPACGLGGKKGKEGSLWWKGAHHKCGIRWGFCHVVRLLGYTVSRTSGHSWMFEIKPPVAGNENWAVVRRLSRMMI